MKLLNSTPTLLALAVYMITASPSRADLVMTCEGGVAVFEVSACGTAPLDFAWLKDDVVIPEAMGPSLEIKLVMREDAGAYHATVTNGFGFATSNSVLLEVILANANCDGRVGLSDSPSLIECTLGPGGGVAHGCRTFDLTDNGDVDLLDFGVFQRIFTGD